MPSPTPPPPGMLLKVRRDEHPEPHLLRVLFDQNSTMGRVTRAKAAEMRSCEDAAIFDINNSSSPHGANAGVAESHLPVQDVKTEGGEGPDRIATIIGEPAEGAATPVSGTMPNTMQRGNSPTRLATPTKFATPARNRDSPGAKALAESEMSNTDSPNASSTYDQLEAAAIQSHTPPGPSRPSTSDDPITALDEMDDAVEMINAEVPDVQMSPQKPKSKKTPIVRTTKASQARLSLAHGPKDPQRRTSSWGKPPAQSAGQRVTSTSSMKSNEDALIPRKEIEIPHSKPRPISMSFPTPPPPPKSSKAPTTSNFQLPGEAIAAKLKAAKEARLQKEADERKKKAFKARPAPSMTKAPAVRQTSTSKARESLMNVKPAASSNSPKRANSVAGTRPSTTSSRPQSTKPAATPSARPTSSKPSATAPLSIVKATQRPSTAMASLTNKPRPASTAPNKPASPASAKPAPSTAARPASRTSKGKEVFSRPLQAKAALEQEKRHKEEAAKKARAEAAERTRRQSREWAEKQRLKKLGVKPESKQSKENVAPPPPADEEAEEEQEPQDGQVGNPAPMEAAMSVESQ